MANLGQLKQQVDNVGGVKIDKAAMKERIATHYH